ncbi:MAG: tetratricopeptide repeat protein [Pseudomonadota bacterium]|nr:tetratricopeptide repeat protein [Pseudomonadota bacterium]
MTPPTDWTPGVTVLVAALFLGAIVVAWSRRGASLPAVQNTRRDELDRQKDAFYGLLREHNAARTPASGPEWAAERDRLELEAARVLRDLDSLRQQHVGDPSPAPSAPLPSGFSARNPRLVGALWGGGAVLFVSGLAFTLQEFAAPRPEGGTMTGNNNPGGSGGAGSGEAGAPALSAAQEAQLARLKLAVDATPDDVAARNAFGHALLHAGKLMDAYKEGEAVVKLRADDPEARTHQAIVLIAIGNAATAATALDKVIAGNPAFAEALAYRGALHYQAGESDQAIALLERAITADPDLTASVGPLIDAARSGTGPKAATNAAGSASSTGPASTEPPGAPSPETVTGTLTLDPSVAAKTKPGDVLFLSARAPGVTGGPPTWTQKQVTVESFPLTFALGPADAMIKGIPTPGELVITARIDRDGNAMTKSADDLVGKSAPLKPGTTNVTITLAAAGPTP